GRAETHRRAIHHLPGKPAAQHPRRRNSRHAATAGPAEERRAESAAAAGAPQAAGPWIGSASQRRLRQAFVFVRMAAALGRAQRPEEAVHYPARQAEEELELVWRFRSPHHLCCDFVMRTSEPKPQ